MYDSDEYIAKEPEYQRENIFFDRKSKITNVRIAKVIEIPKKNNQGRDTDAVIPMVMLPK